MIGELLDKGSSVNAVQRYGQTVLHFACYLSQYERISMLLLARADSRIQDKSGETPIQFAKDSDCIQLLRIQL